MTSAGSVLLVGCGYVGRRLARRLAGSADVHAIVRTPASAAALEQMVSRVSTLDLDAPCPSLPAGSARPKAIVYLVPPPPDGEIDSRIERFLGLLEEPPEVFVYLSTTAVYGDRRGAEVDESTSIAPTTSRARRRADAETRVNTWCSRSGTRHVILRVAGIYGPGRLPLDRLRRSEPIVRPEETGVGTRIHVDDLVSACVAAIDCAAASGIYNVCDGVHLAMADYFTLVARIAGLPAPPLISMAEARQRLSPALLSYLDESRRVRNDRLLKDLGVVLAYADPEAGIRASLHEGTRAGE